MRMQQLTMDTAKTYSVIATRRMQAGDEGYTYVHSSPLSKPDAKKLKTALVELGEVPVWVLEGDPSLFECRCCDACVWGTNHGPPPTWGKILRIDGPNAICPECSKPSSGALDALREEYEFCSVEPGELPRPAF